MPTKRWNCSIRSAWPAHARRACGVLAYGDVKRVELAIALANRPKLLLMDEPTAGMAPQERNELMALTRRLVREHNIGVLFTEHSMDVVFEYADKLIVLARGKVIAEGTRRNRAQPSSRAGGVPWHRQVVHAARDLRWRSQTMSDTEPMLQVSGLNAFYGRAQILFDVGFEVGRGEVVALMGRNGAGKSTTMKAVMGLLPRTAGTVTFRGAEIDALPPYRIARLGLGFVPEDRRVFGDLTVMENLDTGRQPPREGAPHWTPDRLFRLFPNLGEMRERRASRMSGGEQQMLTVSRTLMGNPHLVLLDEPSEGVAPVIVEQMANMILELKREGLSILLSEQNLHFAELVSDRAYVLEKGQVRFSGTMDELARDEAMRRDHLSV